MHIPWTFPLGCISSRGWIKRITVTPSSSSFSSSFKYKPVEKFTNNVTFRGNDIPTRCFFKEILLARVVDSKRHFRLLSRLGWFVIVRLFVLIEDLKIKEGLKETRKSIKWREVRRVLRSRLKTTTCSFLFSKNKGSKQNLNRIHQLGKLII